jgi:hypothetical protein
LSASVKTADAKERRMAVLTASIHKKKLDGLKARRKPLFERYEKNPGDNRLALEIKEIDDQIAECARLIERDRAIRR